MFWGHPEAISIYICLICIVAYVACVFNWKDGKYRKGGKRK